MNLLVAAGLLLIVVLLGVVLLAVTAVLGRRHIARSDAPEPRRSPRTAEPADAWREAGRRTTPPSEPDPPRGPLDADDDSDGDDDGRWAT